MKKALNFKDSPILITFIILASITLFFIIIAAILKIMPNQAYSEIASMKLMTGWQYRNDNSSKTANTNPLWNFNDMNESGWNNYVITGKGLKKNKTFNTVWFRVKLPADKSWINPSVYFEEVLSESFEVYIDNKQIFRYDTLISKSLSYYSTTRNRFIVPLGNNPQGKVLYLKAYSTMDLIGPYKNIVIGSHNELMKMMVRKDYNSIILGFFFIILGIFMLPNIVFLQKQDRKVLIILSMFIISWGIFLISIPTAIKLVVLENSGFWTAINVASTPLILIFFMYFFEQIFLMRYKPIIQKLWRFNIYFYIILLILNFCSLIFKVPDLNITMNIFYALVAIDFSIQIYLVIKNAIKGDIDARIFTVGFVGFASIIIYEITLYIFMNKPPFMFKWGILIFIASFVLILGRRFSDAHLRLLIYSEELEELNKTLEQRVSDRTQELELSMKTLVKTQEQLIQSEKMAALGGLVVGVAHEINTPVGVGITATSYLNKETIDIMELYKDNKMKKLDLEKYLDICRDSSDMILSNLKRAAELITSFKKVAVDQSSEDKRSFNVKKYISDILISLSPEIRKTKHKITLNCPEELELISYPGAISQVVTNLVMNSLIHAYNDGDEGKINFDIENYGGKIVFIYSDDGKGIEKNSLSKIFDPFFTTKRNEGGTGLGLNVVYNIITQRFGGTITCESEISKGTTFIINIPV